MLRFTQSHSYFDCNIYIYIIYIIFLIIVKINVCCPFIVRFLQAPALVHLISIEATLSRHPTKPSPPLCLEFEALLNSGQSPAHHHTESPLSLSDGGSFLHHTEHRSLSLSRDSQISDTQILIVFDSSSSALTVHRFSPKSGCCLGRLCWSLGRHLRDRVASSIESINSSAEMSRSLVQPVGQKRLTNVAVVRLKKRGTRFEIACYKNKVLSWRSGVEKDLDEVLQSHTVYTNVSKGVLAKTKDLKAAFDSDDQTKICLEILDKGELQVAGKERESQLSSQFRDIATIVMQKTYNPETRRPYTISLIESLMHEIHFAVDPHKSSKKQALEVIHELQKHFPIKRSPMRLRLIVPDHEFSSLSEKLTAWNASIISKDQSGSQISTICELDPGFYRECEGLMMKLHGRYEVLALSVHAEGDTVIDQYDDHEDEPSHSLKDSSNISSLKKKECTDPDLSKKESADPVLKLSDDLQKQSISTGSGNAAAEGKQNRCSTCNAFVGDSKQYREHFKSEWHKHNLKRKTRQLPPLTEEECAADMEMDDYKADLRDYSF